MVKNLNITGKFDVGKQNIMKKEKPTFGPGAEGRLRQREGLSNNFVQPVAEGRMRIQEQR